MTGSPATTDLFLALGSNLGDREDNLRRAVREIGKTVGQVEKCSSFMETEPVGFVSENRFLNAAIKVKTTLTPQQCLAETQRIERLLGRERKSVGGQHFDRTIDIDILLYGDVSISTPSLTIPHPKMYERDFVMIPLKEICPDASDASPINR
ncbi:MAG: 2-amino-4-hydroxy-6-hydroxymethyldihydropteridine diphosphokinase [Bacteroidaceae bacterium]|nr:2-amino-4-hydroxy-6-hydroxymethyldihydropteridine diphosphokinase [Bacteroidaceae bacterium]